MSRITLGNMRLTWVIILSTIAVHFLPSITSAQTHVAELYSAQGTVEARNDNVQNWISAQIGAQFESRAAVRTALKSRAGVLFVDGTLVRLNESTFLEFKDASGALPSERPLSLESGTAYFFSREPKRFPRIDTPVVSAAVRGTEFVIKATNDQTIVSVLDGVVECSNQFGSVQLSQGEEAVTNRGQAPVKRIMLQPLDAVQWALSYPAVLSLSDYPDFVGGATASQRAALEALRRGDLASAKRQFSGTTWRDIMGQSIVSYRQGDLPGAFRTLESFSGDKPAGYHVYRASLNLSVGQVESALQDLDRALTAINRLPSSEQGALFASYYSARSIIALVQNKKDEALDFSKKAVAANGDSPASALSQSYVNQAYFNLEAAKRNLEQVVQLEPGSALARARLAEIELSFGDIDGAIKIAEEARTVGPGEAYPSVVLGFAYLSQYRTDAAIAEFEDALNKDATSGAARLGYGLALIRSGKLNEGRIEIEKAVHLEPHVSIYRSYLGKVFYEQDNSKLAENEIARAKSLDPNDPTPHLYGAYQKLATYRPVEALEDIEASIRLNGNRAVYRSSLLLDQDNAVRGASLAQVFNTLGFSQAARIEAIKSVNKDYTNYSAHLFLAQSTGDNQRAAQSSISENIISSLLAPVSFNFILPNPSSQASFNEYTSLFDRPQSRTLLQGGGRTGDESLFGEVIQAGTTERFAYSLRYNADYSDGFRKGNDDSRFQLFSASTQYQLSAYDTVSAKFSVLGNNRGSTRFRFDPYENDPDSGLETDTLGAELGYHHQFGPSSDLIASVSFTNDSIKTADMDVFRGPTLDFDLNDEIPPTPFEMLVDQMSRQRSTGYRGNIQHIWNSNLLTTVTGVELLKAEIDQSENSPITFDEFNLFTGNAFLTTGSHDEDAQSAYLYTILHISERVDLSAGLDFTNIHLGQGSFLPPYTDGERSKNQCSPKAGITIYLTPETTLRGAYFETLGISGPADLDSIQPTVVGGFGQLVDQVPGSSYASYAAGIDHKWPGSTYIGSEYIHSDISTDLPIASDFLVIDPTTLVISRTTVVDNQNVYSYEDEIRSYIYQVLADGWTATLDHSFLRGRDEFFVTTTETNKTRAAINYFDRSGWFGFASATWRYQDRQGYLDTEFSTADEINGNSDFWILGLGAGYQLPNRHGTILFAFQNLLDQKYKYQPTGIDSSPVPEFGAGLAFSINF